MLRIAFVNSFRIQTEWMREWGIFLALSSPPIIAGLGHVGALNIAT